jgi:uncharacterized protein (DUF1330 family)
MSKNTYVAKSTSLELGGKLIVIKRLGGDKATSYAVLDASTLKLVANLQTKDQLRAFVEDHEFSQLVEQREKTRESLAETLGKDGNKDRARSESRGSKPALQVFEDEDDLDDDEVSVGPQQPPV